ncbi:MAG TPA: AAA family ATPase [Candidatus Elarobacter sp.]|nr:AAA family ATPase [Candidatus Elarobacter sp.]
MTDRVIERDASLFPASETALLRLADASGKPIAIVAAPAGTGKSTLLRAFAARHGALLVDLAGAKPTFREAVRLLCEALPHSASGARLAFASAFTRAGERGQRTTAMARWLASYLHGEPMTILVDTLDRLGGETAAFAEFAEALVRCAPAVRLVLAARDHADLPIPRWFAADLTAMPLGIDGLGVPTLRKASPGVKPAEPDEARVSLAPEAAVDELVAAGRVREALELASAAALYDRVVGLLHAHGLALEDRGDVEAVDAALDALPDDHEDATILLLRALRESRLGRTDTAESWFRHAIDRAGSRAESAEAAYRLGREIVRRDRTDAVELLEPYANDPSLDLAHRCAIRSVLAEAYWVAQRADDALAALRGALAQAEELDVAARAHLFARASYIEFYAGDRVAARAHAEVGARLAEEASLYVVAFGAYSVLYNIAYEDAGPSEALASIARLAECAIRCGNVDFHLYALVAAYELEVERGEAAAVEGLERDLREFDLHYGASSAVQGLLPSRALVSAWSGAFASAYELLASTGTQQGADPDREALRWAEIAVYAAAAAMPDAAHDALRSFETALDGDASRSEHSVRAAILAELAAGLLGCASSRAAQLPRGARLRALAHAVRVAVARRRRAASASAFLDALDALRQCEFGGYAKLLAALPEGAA